jgi:hypothetical protein
VRDLTGLGFTWGAESYLEPPSCRLPVRPGSCWVSEQRFDLDVDDRGQRTAWGVGLLLSWNLSRLTFDRAETNSIWQDVLDVQQDVVHTVADYWFERARVLRELAEARQSSLSARALTLRAAEMTATLDALTGGMMTRSRGGTP